MKKDVTLVILAAGMGSRFGGLKQIEPMGPSDEFIIDYSVYDAIKAGFNKIVFIIKRENYELFKETIGKRVEPHIKVEYAFQELNNLPKGWDIPSGRMKPLGTAHAVLCAKDYVNEPFAMINSDDFYGRDAFIKAYEYLSNTDNDSSKYGMIGYMVANTLTENGSVKRGVCNIDNNEYLYLIFRIFYNIQLAATQLTPYGFLCEPVSFFHDQSSGVCIELSPLIRERAFSTFSLLEETVYDGYTNRVGSSWSLYTVPSPIVRTGYSFLRHSWNCSQPTHNSDNHF